MNHTRSVIVDDERGRLVVDFFGGEVVLHLKNIRFTKEAFAAYKALFLRVLEGMRALGYSRVWGTPFSDNPWAVSLVRSFGFKEIRRKNGIVLMRLDLGERHG
jgi:hypothetical protein